MIADDYRDPIPEKPERKAAPAKPEIVQCLHEGKVYVTRGPSIVQVYMAEDCISGSCDCFELNEDCKFKHTTCGDPNDAPA